MTVLKSTLAEEPTAEPSVCIQVRTGGKMTYGKRKGNQKKALAAPAT